MNKEQMISHVDEAVARTLRHEAYIDASVLEIGGFSTGMMRRLVSNLAHGLNNYCEIGLFKGGTFCAAINNNPELFATGIENFSQDFGQHGVREELLSNIANHKGNTNIDIRDEDCFGFPAIHFFPPRSQDMLLYDGHHDQEYQAKALPHFFDAMAPVFLYAVDDYSWPTVVNGTNQGFSALAGKAKIEKDWLFYGKKTNEDPEWWNGFAVFCCSKL